MESKLSKKFKTIVASSLMLTAMLLSMFVSLPQTALAATAKTFDFVEVTDLHGTLNPVGSTQPVAAILAKQIKDIKAANPDTVLLAGGDMFQGSAQSNILKGQPVIDMMKNIGFDAMALGNHEYDWGIDKVINPQNAVVRGTTIPVLAANIYDKTTGKPASYTKPVLMLKKDGVKIGVIGVVDNKEFATAILPALIKDVDFKDPAPIVNQLAKDLKSQGAQIVIVLAHMGAYTDKNGAVNGNLIDLTKQLSGVDAVFGGHSHSIVTTKVNNIPVGVANVNGKGYLDLKVTLNADGTVSTGDMSYKDDIPLYTAKTPLVDADVQAILDKANQELGPILNEVLGTTDVDLTRAQSAAPYGDSIIGNWASLATKDAAKTDFAFSNNGGLRCDIPKGNIKTGDIWTLMPFDNTIYSMTMTGEQIKTVLEDAVQEGGVGIQADGISFTYDPKKPTMNRVTSMKKSDGTSIMPTQTYTVAVNNFMATGGDKFSGFNDPAIINKQDTGILVRDVFIAAVKAQKTLAAGIDYRIKPKSVDVIIPPTPEVSEQTDKYVQPIAPASVKSGKIIAKIGLNVRAGASLSNKILGALPYGSMVDVVEVCGDWDKIIYNGGYGYVYAKYVA